MRYCNFGVSPVNYSDSELACLATQIYRLQFRIKTQKANQKGPKHDCIAYIPILDNYTTRDINHTIKQHMRCSWVCRICITNVCLSRLNRFSRVKAYIYIVYLFISCYHGYISYTSAVFFLSTIGANRLGGETTSGAKRLEGAKRLGGKRLGGETTRGGNGLGAKRPGFTQADLTRGRLDPDSYLTSFPVHPGCIKHFKATGDMSQFNTVYPGL